MIVGADMDASKWSSVQIQDNASLFAAYKAEGTAVAETPKSGLQAESTLLVEHCSLDDWVHRACALEPAAMSDYGTSKRLPLENL